MVEPISSQPFPPHAIAIVGLAGRFPGAGNLDDFWRNVLDGVESLETLSDAELDVAGVPEALRSNPHFVRKCTALEQADYFDASFFGISPREAQIIDPQHRIFIECAWEALEHAGHSARAPEQSVGVYAGASINTYLIAQLLRDPALVATVGGYQLMLGNDKDFLCTRVSYKLDLRGPSLTIQTACSTSLVAVEVACRALQHGECDLALAGGVSVTFPQRTGYLYEEGMILSPDGHCRPFDADARGTRGGAGAGIVVLKRLADAVADRDTIHAVIRGAAINNDGAGKAGYTAPSVDGQVEAIAMAQALAGVSPRTISYIETHGTGTSLGDSIEIAALTQVFRASTNDIGYCRIGSLKANLGHLDAAAGVAGLIKTVLALNHRQIPPLVNFHKANPHLNLEVSPFLASSSASPWTRDGSPRRAGVSSFGIGGTNAHVVLEEAPATAPSAPIRDAHLLVISAKTTTALDQATKNLAIHLGANAHLSLTDVEWTLAVGRQVFPHRRAVVVKDRTQAAELLGRPHLAPVLTGTHEGGGRSVAFLFSGQGSQHVGMGASLYGTERVYREAIDLCAAILEPHLGLDIRKVVFGSEDDPAINETHLTQPLLFATEYALASLWMQWGITRAAMLGHSIGEYVAAHLAGVMTLEDALAVVAARGRLMQALPPGSMAAVHCAAGELVRWLGEGVEIAAINAPGLCTVSGPTAGIAGLLKRLEADGIETRVLNTSHAFHSAMMEPALAPFTAVLDRIPLAPPRMPYVSNVTGKWITPEQAMSPAYYATHLRRAVQFEAGVRTLATDPATLFLEVGPGNALASLARLTLGKERARHVFSSLSHPRESRPDGEAALEAAGRLWLAGVGLNWARLHAESLPRRIPLPTYPFERERHWVAGAVPRPSDHAAPSRSEDVENWLFAPTWIRDAVPSRQKVGLSGAWVVLAQPGALADALADELTEVGARAIVVEHGDGFEIVNASRFRVRPDQPQDIAAMVRQVRTTQGPVRGAICSWDEVEARAACAALTYRRVVMLAENLQLAMGGQDVSIIIATSGAQSVLDEPVHDVAASVALGPVLGLPTEVPGLVMRAVDFDGKLMNERVKTVAQTLVNEAAKADGENLVAWRGGRRWLRRYERLRLQGADPTELPLKPRGVYLITGGLGGIGVTLARWLAGRTSARLLLTARTPLPPREGWDRWLAEHPTDSLVSRSIHNIRDIERAGGEVIAAAADAADLKQMKVAIAGARARWGEIDGVVHAAGIAGNGRLAFLKQAEDVEAVFSPKIDGLGVLVRLLGDTPLDFVALMSSINAVLGTPGASDYAAANAFLDAFVDAATCPPGWRNVVAFDWGAWRDVGMAAQLIVPDARRAMWEEHLRSGIPSEAGTDIFARILSSGQKRVVISPYDLLQAAQFVRALGHDIISHQPGTPALGHVKPKTGAALPPEGTARDVEQRLIEIWSELLGVQRIGTHDDFFLLGGHSLLATRLMARIYESFGVRLSLRDVFDAPTVCRLAERVAAIKSDATKAFHRDEEEREEMVF